MHDTHRFETQSTHTLLFSLDVHVIHSMRAHAHARKNIYERLIGILVHSNNCCAHLTNKNHIGNKFLVLLVIIQYCVLMNSALTVCFATSPHLTTNFAHHHQDKSTLADSAREQKAIRSIHAACCAHLPPLWFVYRAGHGFPSVARYRSRFSHIPRLSSFPFPSLLPCLVISAAIDCILSKISSGRGHQEGRVQRRQRHVIRAHACLLCGVLAEGATSD